MNMDAQNSFSFSINIQTSSINLNARYDYDQQRQEQVGADPAAKDTEFEMEPAGWAEHFNHEQVAKFLRG